MMAVKPTRKWSGMLATRNDFEIVNYMFLFLYHFYAQALSGAPPWAVSSNAIHLPRVEHATALMALLWPMTVAPAWVSSQTL